VVADQMDNVFESPTDGLPGGVYQYLFPCPLSLTPRANLNRLHSDAIRNIPTSRLLGTGGFGSVYLGQIGTMEVAVKRLHSSTKNVAAVKESFEAEQRLIRLSHPNVVRLLASTTDTRSDAAVIVMEYAGDCSLQHIINQSEEPIDICTRIRYALNIASGLDYIHGQCIVHLDLKPANIIVSSNDACKIVDFGCCQETTGNTGEVSPTHRSCLTGTFAYRAPELFKGKAPSTKADLYAFGVTLWQMLSMEQPYSCKAQECVIFAVVSTNLRPQLPDNIRFDRSLDNPVEDCYRELYRQCWDADIDTRPSAADVVDVLSTWREEVSSYDDSVTSCDTVRDYEQHDHELYSKTFDTSFHITAC
jgi:proto-oncogene serine/threonine-protein kinase mos